MTTGECHKGNVILNPLVIPRDAACAARVGTSHDPYATAVAYEARGITWRHPTHEFRVPKGCVAPLWGILRRLSMTMGWAEWQKNGRVVIPAFATL
jgi:hypothetical protein